MITVPDHWVKVGGLANEISIEQEALAAIEDGLAIADTKLVDWSFA